MEIREEMEEIVKKINWIESIQKEFKKKDIYLFFLILSILFLLSFTVELTGDYDNERYTAWSNMPYGEYLKQVYTTLNGRTIPNTIEYFLNRYHLLWVWKLINPLMIVCLAYAMVRMIQEKIKIKRINQVLLGIGLLSNTVLSSAMYWFTGSIFYLWPATFAAISLIPVADYFLRKKEMKITTRNFGNLFCGILVMMSSEQMACFVLGFYLLAFLHSIFIQKEKRKVARIIPIFVLLIFFLTLILSPATKYRFAMASQKYETYYNSTFLQRMENGIIWTFDKIFHEQKLVMFMLGISTIVCYKERIQEKGLKWIYLIFQGMLSFAILSIFICAPNYEYFIPIKEYLYHFEKINWHAFTIKAMIPYIFWCIYLLCQLLLLSFYSKNKVLDIICFLAGIGTLMIMWFSPTMYVSGNRTCFVFGLTVIYLIFKMYQENRKEYSPVVLTTSLANMIFFLLVLFKNYVIYY